MAIDTAKKRRRVVGVGLPFAVLTPKPDGTIDAIDRATLADVYVPKASIIARSSELERSPASIMAAYIITTLVKMADPSDGDSWPLYISHLPDGKNVKTDAGAIYDTAGTTDIRSMNGNVYQHPGIQIRIRASDYEVGYARIEEIVYKLDDVFNDVITINSVDYEIQNASRTSPIVSLGVEPGTVRRFHFTVNYLLTLSLLIRAS